MITVYGIKQCDTCRKALKWLSGNAIDHRFHDLREQGLDKAMLESWLDSEFADVLVNRRSTTWRTLTESQKASKGEALVSLLLANPTLVKRPVFIGKQMIGVGFTPKVQETLLGARS